MAYRRLARAHSVGRISEEALQSTIRQAAHLLGYLCYHTYDARRSPAGYPDFTLVSPVRSDGRRRLIFAELKSAQGRCTPEQVTWIDALTTVHAPPLVEIWKPCDLDRVLKLLQETSKG